ncbi:hypothetical protein [Demequina sp. NBRC 110051]|uniref:hypothetical protein n=1 Tax=Demequina sp. NBRC 110051 TaxID=1570340 RepID=UPI0009FDFE53|nr:hypothetical protein [Demequina sp. NBRC 110051]
MPSALVASVASRVRTSPPTPGGARIVLIDGPAGAGKTTFADRLSMALDGAPVLHADDMYEGWEGLATLTDLLVRRVLAPLAQGRAAEFACWDWHAGRRGAALHVEPAPVVVIEGVGVGQRAARAFASLLVWVEAPAHVRHERWLDREGPQSEGHWTRWAQSEAEHFAQEHTREAAEVTVDGAASRPGSQGVPHI